jgi:hypothetical protein
MLPVRTPYLALLSLPLTRMLFIIFKFITVVAEELPQVIMLLTCQSASPNADQGITTTAVLMTFL